jgi:hypothetical protein
VAGHDDRDRGATDGGTDGPGTVGSAPVAEAVAGHLDRRAKPTRVEQAGQLGALVLAEDGVGDRMALAIKLALEEFPVELVDAAVDVGGGVRHGHTTHRRHHP